MIETLPPEELEWRAQHSQAQQIRIQTAQASQSNRGMLIVDIPKFQQQRLSKESDFIQWYVDDYMPNNLPDAAQGFKQAELNTLIKNGRNQAIQQGFIDPQNQVHFVTLMWQVGANF
jgi:aminoglycoside/choline kinase family phosphotransferase